MDLGLGKKLQVVLGEGQDRPPVDFGANSIEYKPVETIKIKDFFTIDQSTLNGVIFVFLCTKSANQSQVRPF